MSAFRAPKDTLHIILKQIFTLSGRNAIYELYKPSLPSLCCNGNFDESQDIFELPSYRVRQGIGPDELWERAKQNHTWHFVAALYRENMNNLGRNVQRKARKHPHLMLHGNLYWGICSRIGCNAHLPCPCYSRTTLLYNLETRNFYGRFKCSSKSISISDKFLLGYSDRRLGEIRGSCHR